MTGCVRGCTWPGSHNPPCTCTTDCPKHDTHCHGCQPVDATVGQWCARCAHTVTCDLADIPDLAQQVDAGDGRLRLPTGPQTGIRAPSPAPASPSPALDLRDEVEHWFRTWTDFLCEETRMVGPDRYSRITGLPDVNMWTLSAFMVEHLAWFATAEPVQFYDETTGLRHQLENASGGGGHVDRPKEPCPRCDLLMMVYEYGTGRFVRCENPVCLASYTAAEWDRLTGATA